MLRPLISIACLATAVALTGCQNDKGATTRPDAAVSLGALNDTCPISGRTLGAGAVTRQYEGATIGFCCDACPPAWMEQSDEEKDAYVAELRKE